LNWHKNRPVLVWDWNQDRRNQIKLTLKSVRPEAGNVKTFVFSPESEVSWKAGQYMHYVLPQAEADDRGEERWFTISSAPHEKDLQITTRIFDKGGSS